MTVRRESVTYRLATSGKQDILSDLADIASGGESSAKRMSAAYQKDLRLAEASVERLERRSQALLTLGGSDIQRRIASSTGLAASLPGGKDAERSMQVFIQQQQQLEQARARLLAQYNPLFAAQQRYNQVLEEANRLHARGSLTTQELTQVQQRARQELQKNSVQYEAMQKTSGVTRVGIQQLGFQISDFAVQVSGGTSALRAFALQGPQAVQALALMGQGAQSGTSKFAAMARLLQGPWGAALTVGVSLLGVMSTKLFETEDASDASVRGLKKVETQAERTANAMQRLIALRERTTEMEIAESQGRASQLRERELAILAQLDRRRVRGGANRRRVLEEELRQIRYDLLTPQAAIDQGERVQREERQKEREAQLKRDEAAARAAARTGARDARAYERQLREAAKLREENARSLRTLIEASNPLAAIANSLADDLAEINRLAGLSPSQGGIGSEQADILRQQAQQRAQDARGGLFADAFRKMSDSNAEEDALFQERRGFLDELVEEQAAANRLIDLEFKLIGASNAERSRALANLAFKEDLLARGIDLSREDVIALIEGNDAILKQVASLGLRNQEIAAQRRVGEQIIDTIFDTAQWDDWGALGKRVIQELIREMLILSAINPLKNSLFGTNLPTSSGGLFGFLGSIFGNAIGTESSPGGLRYVGEFGKELVRLPRGAQVLNASRTRAIERAATPMRSPSIYNINAPGADPAQLQRLIDEVRTLDRNLERRAIEATTDLNERTFGRAYAMPR